jgi:hypothetical protein
MAQSCPYIKVSYDNMKLMVITYSDDFAFFLPGSAIDILTGVESGERRAESGCFDGDSCIVRKMASLHLYSSVLSWI